MAQFRVDWWGPKLELTHEETQSLLLANDISVALVAIGVVPIPPIPPEVIPVLATYIAANRALIAAVDVGNGVWLTIPWPAIWWGQWWIIVPTSR